MRHLVKIAVLAASIFLTSCATTQPVAETKPCPYSAAKATCHEGCKSKADHKECTMKKACKHACKKSCKKHHKHKAKAKAASTTDTTSTTTTTDTAPASTTDTTSTTTTTTTDTNTEKSSNY